MAEISKLNIVQGNDITNKAFSSISSQSKFEDEASKLLSNSNKVEISDDEKRIMLACGYTIDTWLALDEDTRAKKIDEYITQNSSVILPKEQKNKPKLNLQLPENWNDLDVKSKQNFLFNEFGRAYVENWDALSKEEKSQIIENQLAAFCEKVNPQFRYMNAKDKEKAMEIAYVTFGVVVENADKETIGNGGLLEAYENLTEGNKRQIRTQMSSVAGQLGLHISEQDRIRIDDNKAVAEYFGLKKGFPNDRQRLEYYRHLQQDGKLNEFQQREFDILVQKEQVDPSAMSHSHRKEEHEALTSIEGVFSIEGKPFIKNKRDLLDINSDTNRERLITALNTRFGNTADLDADDEKLREFQAQIADIYSGLSSHEKDFFLNTILRDGNIDRRLIDGIKDTAGRLVAANDEHVSSEVRSEAIDKHTVNVAERRANGEKVETQGFYDYVNSDDNHFDDNNKSDLQVNVLKDLGEEEVGNVQRSLKENCSNYLDIFALTDKKVNNDADISDDLKQFYAQKSIEIMDSDADRQARSNSLNSYNNASFNKGVQKGYENIANGTVSGSKNSSNAVPNNVTNPITNNSQNSQILSQNIQDAQRILKTYGDGEPMPLPEAVKIFQRMELTEQKEFLSSLSPQQVSQIPITVCNSFPELIGKFVDLGKGVEIIQQCNVNTGNRTIRYMASSKGAAKKQFNEWAANHTDRLAKCTYDDLVAQGAIRVDENKAFTARC